MTWPLLLLLFLLLLNRLGSFSLYVRVAHHICNAMKGDVPINIYGDNDEDEDMDDHAL